MPEVGIGLYPDIGAAFFLQTGPEAAGKGLAAYLAVTGARLKGAWLRDGKPIQGRNIWWRCKSFLVVNVLICGLISATTGAEVQAAGLATHCVPHAAMHDVEAALHALGPARARDRSQVCMSGDTCAQVFGACGLRGCIQRGPGQPLRQVQRGLITARQALRRPAHPHHRWPGHWMLCRQRTRASCPSTGQVRRGLLAWSLTTADLSIPLLPSHAPGPLEHLPHPASCPCSRAAGRAAPLCGNALHAAQRARHPGLAAGSSDRGGHAARALGLCQWRGGRGCRAGSRGAAGARQVGGAVWCGFGCPW